MIKLAVDRTTGRTILASHVSIFSTISRARVYLICRSCQPLGESGVGQCGERFDVWPRLRAEALWLAQLDTTEIDVCERIDHMHYWRSDTYFAQPHTSVWFFQMVSSLGRVSKLRTGACVGSGVGLG